MLEWSYVPNFQQFYTKKPPVASAAFEGCMLYGLQMASSYRGCAVLVGRTAVSRRGSAWAFLAGGAWLVPAR